MGSSPGFGSAARDWGALFGLAFATAPPQWGLTSPHTATRRFILQKARSHASALRPDNASTACRHTVSGSISLPSRGSFHFSLTVLVHYRSEAVFSLRRWASQIHTGFLVSRVTWEPGPGSPTVFAYRALTFCGATFQTTSANGKIGNFPAAPQCRPARPHDPAPTTPVGYHMVAV